MEFSVNTDVDTQPLVNETGDNSSESRSADPDPELGAMQAVKPVRKSKSRVMLNFWLDATLLVTVLFIGWISAVLHIVFPAPTVADGWTLWGRTFNQWRDIQSTALCLCGLLALEHIVLHWTWICSTIATRIFRVKQRPDEGAQAIYGVGTFIVTMILVVGSVAVAMLSVQQPGI